MEASDLNAVQFCRKELKNQEVEDDEMQVATLGGNPGMASWAVGSGRLATGNDKGKNISVGMRLQVFQEAFWRL